MHLEPRLKKIMLTGLFLVVFCQTPRAAFGQGTFQNLDFESPVLPLVSVPNSSFNFVYISNALPGWTGYLANDQQPAVLYNNLFLGTAVIAFEGPGSPTDIFQGSYSVVLQSGSYMFTGNQVGAAIAQTGMIPSDAHSMRFLAAGQVTVSFEGYTLSLVSLMNGPSFSTLLGADISAFAGQTGELRFSAPALLGFPNNVFLDDISFSPQPIPEPGVFGFIALGSLLLGWRWRLCRFQR